MCKLLEVSRSGYYAWARRDESAQAKSDRWLLDRIRVIFAASRRTYGAPRVHAELVKDGICVGRKRVARLMADAGLRGRKKPRKKLVTTDSDHPEPIAPNLLLSADPPSEPNQQWAADITYLPTNEGYLYLATVIDLYSRKVVGWSMQDHMRVDLTLEALAMALKVREPSEGLIHHSDRGSQYSAEDYQELLREHGIRPSMSRKANCYDNATQESFYKTLKAELVYRRRYATRAEAKTSVFEFIEAFYNRYRLHSSLGYMSPEEFERVA